MTDSDLSPIIIEAFEKEFSDEPVTYQEMERMKLIFKAGFISGASHVTQELLKDIDELSNG